MSTWFRIWLTLAVVIGLVWLVRYAKMGRILRKRKVLSSHSYNDPPEDAPKVSILIAAKDEEDNVEACINDLLEQDYPDYELIVVDDRSRDRTPDILRRLEQQAAGRLRVVTVTALRDGWFGKNNAMREGVEASCGDWLLFTDADCRQTSRKTLSIAMREALSHDSDFLSVIPVLETRTTWERIIQPVCTLALMIWFLPHRVNRPWRKTAYANGAFMLMRRSCYEAIGGHERVRTKVNEDIQMARFAKQMGLRLRVVENDDLYRTRMYDSPLAAWRGWSRIFYGCLGSLTRLSSAASVLILLSIVPWVSLITALTGLVLADVSSVRLWAFAACVWLVVVVLEQLVTWRVYAVLRVEPVWSLTYVLGAIVTLGMLVNAMFKTIGATGTTWRGTTYIRRHSQVCVIESTPPSPKEMGHPRALP
ncbi:MAG: glycosyltransferase family 2 protein [Phycisphaerae bacterium]